MINFIFLKYHLIIYQYIFYYLLLFKIRESIRIENIRIKFKFIEYIQIHIHSNGIFLLFNSFESGFFA